MRRALTALSVLVIVLGLSAAAWAGAAETTLTLTGEIQCAMCTLKKADAKECQSVLVVTGDHAGEYYLVKNAVVEAYGHVCKGAKPATITGTIEEKDGKTWLTASEVKEPGTKG